MVNTCRVLNLGTVAYEEVYQLQKRCVEAVLAGGPNMLILCEHPAILTLGRLAKAEYILANQDELAQQGVTVKSIDRGGEVTLHAPGQLVVYPILNLNAFGKDLKVYLHKLEQVGIDLLGDFDIVADRISGRTGVWVRQKKIASLGIGVKKWISYHGVGLNVSTDLNLFKLIKPCGLDVQMTTIEQIKGQKVDMNQVKFTWVKKFAEQFLLEIHWA